VPVGARHDPRQVALDLHGIVLLCQTEPLREPAHVRVHDDPLRVPELGGDDVCGLAGDARKADELLEPPRHLTAELLEQDSHRTANSLRLLAEEAGLEDVALELLLRHGEVVLRPPVLAKERAGDAIHVHVGRLRRQHRRHEQLEVRAETERDARIGVVTCRVDLADPHGRIWSIGSRKNRWLAPIDFAPWPIDSRLAATAHDVDYVLGAVMLVRVAALRAVGLFDERYFFYYEDLDLSLRLASAGYRLRYVPLPVVLHAGAATSGRETALSEYHQGRSSVVFYATHGRGARLAFGIYRVGSAVGRVARLCARGHWRETGAYLRGTRDGLRTLREHPRPVIA